MSRETALWADSWYPWLANGWVKCACGEYFHSREGGARANDLHAEHVTTAPIHQPPGAPRPAACLVPDCAVRGPHETHLDGYGGLV